MKNPIPQNSFIYHIYNKINLIELQVALIQVNNAAKIKILFTKPKTGSMYSIKLINESFSKTLPRRFQGLIVGRKRVGSLR